MKIDSKEDQFFIREIQESQQTAKVAQERFSIDTLDVLKEKLNLISLKDWLLWSTCDNCVNFILPHIENSKITIQASLTINSQLGTKAFCHNQPTPLSINCLTDIRQIEVLLSECYSYLNDYKHADIVQHHINSAKRHIIKAMDNIEKFSLDDTESELKEKVSVSTYLPRLQFILCQIENATVAKNRRRYNILTQVYQLINLGVFFTV